MPLQHNKPVAGTANEEALLRSVAGVVARQVQGVHCMGEGLLQDLHCENGTCSDPGHGVTVHRWGEDIFLYIHLCCDDQADEPALRAEIEARVRATLDNLLFIHPAAIDIQIDRPQMAQDETENTEKFA